MNEPATLPAEPGSQAEVTELSILDVVRHALRVIMSSLEAEDRIAIVPFGSSAHIAADLTPMDDAGKKLIDGVIDTLHPAGTTNLWDGLKHGLNLLVPTARENLKLPVTAPVAEGVATENGRVTTVFCLTDGCPNVTPPRGHVDTLAHHLKTNAAYLTGVTIHTFGFGYSLDSALLMHLARVGAGMYAFVPDLGMLGTVFVHALANALSVWATQVALEIEFDGSRVGVEVVGTRAVLNADKQPSSQVGQPLTIPIGDVRYGQSRDIVLRVTPNPDGPSSNAPLLTAVATYLPWSKLEKRTAFTSLHDLTSLSPESAQSVNNESLRIQLADALLHFVSNDRKADLLPRTRIPETPSKTSNEMGLLAQVTTKLNLSNHPAHADADGQVNLALEPAHWNKWGRHYLPSLALAHALQRAVNFRDPGQLGYGADCPLFVESRDRANDLFDQLPPPKPAPLPARATHSATSQSASKRSAVSSMRVWNTRSGPCVAGESLVRTPSGEHRIDQLCRGDEVLTPLGPRQIVAILRTQVFAHGVDLCTIDGLRVTPWHPIRRPDGDWVFPSKIASAARTASEDCPFVFSLLLAPDAHADAHAFFVGKTAVVTLGSGASDDVRKHDFLGNWVAIASALTAMPGWSEPSGVVRCSGTTRRGEAGEISGFLPNHSAEDPASCVVAPFTENFTAALECRT
ncbi:hint-domain-containing protein [Auriculariales sp. MPI-PUGE-AT-0066]|nr:hint-domain-containing protein [Auriculariales sp. MPI-PUGE-AT-0066]